MSSNGRSTLRAGVARACEGTRRAPRESAGPERAPEERKARKGGKPREKQPGARALGEKSARHHNTREGVFVRARETGGRVPAWGRRHGTWPVLSTIGTSKTVELALRSSRIERRLLDRGVATAYRVRRCSFVTRSSRDSGFLKADSRFKL